MMVLSEGWGWRTVSSLRELAGRTPAWRLRHVDLLRAAAIVAVVVGHWLMTTVERGPDGRLTGFSALGALGWAHPITWLFQVMPVFFLVGGVANGISWTRHRDRGGSATTWLVGRSRRLFPPVTALLVVLAVGAGLTRWLGAGLVDVGQVVAVAVLPLWFLVVYVGVVALTPVTYRWHERWALRVPAVLVAGVVAGDVLRLATGVELWAVGSFAFGWLAIYQAGYAWRGDRGRPGTAWAMFLGGISALVLLTVPGPYPVSLVTVPGAAMQNSSPPSAALLALAVAQLGAAMLVARPAQVWLRRWRPWAAVLGLNAVILTVFLWHMVAAVIGGVAMDAVGLLPPSDPPAGAWWAGRVPWLVVLGGVLAALVAVVGRVETRAVSRAAGGVPGAGRWRPPTWVARTGPVTGAYGAAVVGLLWIVTAGAGVHGPLVLPTGAVLLVLAGTSVLRLARARRPTTT